VLLDAKATLVHPAEFQRAKVDIPAVVVDFLDPDVRGRNPVRSARMLGSP
jgi:hypothetical protein